MTRVFLHGSRRAEPPASVASAVVPLLAALFATVLLPVIYFFTPPAHTLSGMMESRIEPRIVWPSLAAIAIVTGVRNTARLRRIDWPPHIVFLLIYLGFAGASVVWAFNPQLSLIRFVQQALIVIAIVIPTLFAYRRPDIMRAAFICYAIGGILNVYFVMANPAELVNFYNGHPGYFLGKNYLGEFAGAMFLLAVHEACYKGQRRVVGICMAVTAITLLVLSDSKTAFGFAFLAPLLAALTLIAAKGVRLSPATLLLAVLVGYLVLSMITGIGTERFSYMIYGDSTFTGRTIIWEFAKQESARSPLLGWGYQSFWLAGPSAPSLLAPGWVKYMPNAHNGYYDALLETGYVGLGILWCFIFFTLRAIGRVSKSDPIRAWSLLSIALYIIFYNFLESLWFRGFEFLWVLFLLIVAETVAVIRFPGGRK